MYIARWFTFWPSAFALIASTLGSSVVSASLLQPDATLPPPSGVYTLPTVCITPVCLVNANVAGFHTTSDVLLAGNELVSATAVFSALVFQNNGGTPGAALGSVSTGGTIDFTYFGRSLSTPLGTFDAEITAFDFAGTFNGHTFEFRKNPLLQSTGMTTINQVSPNGPYKVDSFFDVFAELSLDNGPFVPGPLREIVLTGVPEPGTGVVVLLGLLGVRFVSRFRRV